MRMVQQRIGCWLQMSMGTLPPSGQAGKTPLRKLRMLQGSQQATSAGSLVPQGASSPCLAVHHQVLPCVGSCLAAQQGTPAIQLLTSAGKYTRPTVKAGQK